LIDSQGHIVHIDFGFLFDISPGRNMKFESAEFKLTRYFINIISREYINIMGGHHNTEAFNYYVDLTTKGFLEIRHYQEHIFNVIRIMATTGLKCFRPKSLQVIKINICRICKLDF
jgi:phosphatidylinositol 4-kinase